MADKLTRQQVQAVSDRGGCLLVSAAAGSGKTKVLVDRLLSYLTDPRDPANLDEFVIITYTKAAANELRSKIAAKLSERIAEEPGNRHLQKQLQRLFLTKISTVHGFCGDIVREYAYRLDIPTDFRVADENECKELREAVLADLLEQVYSQEKGNQDFFTFVDSLGFGRDDRFIPELVEKVYDNARCHLDPDQWLENCISGFESEGMSDVSQTPWGRFLVEDLHRELDRQIYAMEHCAREAEDHPKIYGNLWDTLEQLKTLRRLDTWDEIYQNRAIRFDRLMMKGLEPDRKDRIKAVRDACKAELGKRLESFSDSSVQVFEDMVQNRASAKSLIGLVREFENDYGRVKRNRHILDFSDLEHKMLDLLYGRLRRSPTATATEIGRRYREILVDEYQDSNEVQDAIFTALTAERQNCFLVGDVKQSIYQFRLADPGIFLKKYHAFLPAEEAVFGQGRKVMLSHNFRSGPEIVECVNDVFGCCMRPGVGGLAYGEDEALREGIPREPLPDGAVELYLLQTQEETYPEEAEFVAGRIETMLREGALVRGSEGLRPVTPEDIVILLRSPGSTGSHFQRALEARGIRCSSGNDRNLLQTEEVETLYSFLQTILNPRQDINLLGTLASPIFGFTADDLAQFRAGRKQCSIYDALLQSDTPKARSFLNILNTLRVVSRMNTVSVLLQRCFTLTRLDSIYGAMPGGNDKRVHLQAFYQLAVDYEQGGLRDLSQFLNYIEVMAQNGRIQAQSSASGCVTIMSIHKSKGLEFPVVFLCNLNHKFSNKNFEDKIFCDKELGLGLPVADTSHRVYYPSIGKRAIGAKMRSERTSEELRLLYVAMTRARDRLIMTYASRHLTADSEKKTSSLNELQKIALRQDHDGGELLCHTAGTLGRWVLLAASQRTEAGELHALGGRPKETRLGKFPWVIRYVETAAASGTHIHQPKAEETAVSLEQLAAIEHALQFRYPYETATAAPSKQTATGRKGRQKDEEAAENTKEPPIVRRSWRVPSFRADKAQGILYGTTVHTVMQYIRYANCKDPEGVRNEVSRLVSEGILKQEQADMVDWRQINDFFQTEIGRKLVTGCDHIREFKFSILEDGSRYGEHLEGEKILLQGVVDCALLEKDGITIVDFKTDHVTEQTLPTAVERYRTQVLTYGDALERIYEKPVKAIYLYFFHLNRFVKVS